jgi:transposase InsO family protein
MERILLGLWTLLINPRRIARSTVILKPSTLLQFHLALVGRKYRLLFSSRKKRRSGQKGPSGELIRAILEMKRRNPRHGCPKIALFISRVFGVEIDKDVVRRVLAKHNRPNSTDSGPSWLTFIGNARDSLWSVDLFRCESIRLKSHWVMVVMDQFTRRIVGFAVQAGDIDGVALCRMFNRAISGMGAPVYLSSDHDPLFTFHRWQANLRILEVEEIKTIPYVPISHPFIERLIGTIRREYLDHVLFWSEDDLARKLEEFRTYYNGYRVHSALNGETPSGMAGHPVLGGARLDAYQWRSHCRGLFQTPTAA